VLPPCLTVRIKGLSDENIGVSLLVGCINTNEQLSTSYKNKLD
jgi:hypothetical protein